MPARHPPSHAIRLAAAIAATALAAATTTSAADAVVEQPRAFGHVIGDVLAQRVLLEADGRAFEPADLPSSERIGAWLERRTPRHETAPDGRRWLVVEYQLVNAPQALTRIDLPAWQLAAASGGGVLDIPAWPLTVAPLSARRPPGVGDLQPLRPDRPPPLVATTALERRLHLWSALLALTLAAWAGWLLLRNRRAAASQPFARAWRELRRGGDDAPEAWRALHRAFDSSAGRVVQPGSLAVLFERAPHFAPLRPAIERFYQQSSARFFGAGASGEPVSPRALCRELRRIEKRHER